MAPYSFSEFGRSGPLNRQSDFVIAPYSTRNPIKYSIPELLYLDGGLSNVPYDGPGIAVQPDQGVLHKLMNIWTTDWIQHSIMNDGEFLQYFVYSARCHKVFSVDSPFCFLPLLNLSPGDTHELYESPLLRRCLLALEEERIQNMDNDFFM